MSLQEFNNLRRVLFSLIILFMFVAIFEYLPALDNMVSSPTLNAIAGVFIMDSTNNMDTTSQSPTTTLVTSTLNPTTNPTKTPTKNPTIHPSIYSISNDINGYKCLLCDESDIINTSSNINITYYGLKITTQNEICAQCKYGLLNQEIFSNKNSFYNKLIGNNNIDTIYFIGSSTIRHIYNNLISQIQNHSKIIIEHYYHDPSTYYMNKTHDNFIISHKTLPKMIIKNPTLKMYMFFNAKLLCKTGEWFQKMTNINDIKNKNIIIILGQHFWMRQFIKENIYCLNEMLKYVKTACNKLTIFWINVWNKRNRDTFHYNVNENSTKWINSINDTYNINIIDIKEILIHKYGKKDGINIFNEQKMVEDSMHFQCNFKYIYPRKIENIKNRKHHRHGGDCTDPLNEMMLQEMISFFE